MARFMGSSVSFALWGFLQSVTQNGIHSHPGAMDAAPPARKRLRGKTVVNQLAARYQEEAHSIHAAARTLSPFLLRKNTTVKFSHLYFLHGQIYPYGN